MNPARQMNLGVYAVGTGNHVSGWRVPGAATSSEDFAIFKTIADSCERGKLDFLFVGDSLAFIPDQHPGQMLRFEPLTLHAALATQTSRVGLVATASTTYSAPFNVARTFASLDKLSGGRAGWNVVTTSMPEAAGNFGSAGPMDHATRYESAAEFVEVVQGLWDSWEEGAITANRETGEYFDKTKVHSLDYVGKFYSVSGPLNISRSRQGQPVIFQAGTSEEGRDLAARIANGIYANEESFEEAQEYYQDIKRRAVAYGRDPNEILIFPGLVPIIADTDEQAKLREEEINGKLDLKKALVQLGRPFNYHDFSQYPLDEPFPELGDLGQNGYRGGAERIKRVAREGKLTLRETAWRFAARRSPFVGSPLTVANEMERWFREGAVDGFNFRISNPTDFDDFVQRVLPILRERGVIRRDYEHDTLRGHLGLPIPANRHTLARRASDPQPARHSESARSIASGGIALSGDVE